MHRALIAALKLGDGGFLYEPEALAETAAHISMAERRAMAAERETVDRLIAHFLADRVGTRFPGRVSGVTRSGMFVKLRDTGADGYIPAASIDENYWRYDEIGQQLVSDRTGEAFRLGDDVEVRLVEAIPGCRHVALRDPLRGQEAAGIGTKEDSPTRHARVRGASTQAGGHPQAQMTGYTHVRTLFQ